MMSRSVRAIAAVCVMGAALTTGAGAAPEPQKFVYTIHHSRYGKIGTFTNTVVRNGDDTTVSTEVRIAVSILGVTFYRQDASRQEQWDGDRLVSFHGITTTNGNAIKLDGSAQGDHFVLKTPGGEKVAPANVRLANPWSPAILGGNFLFTPDRGRLDKVRVSGGDPASFTVAGRAVQAKKYNVYLLDGMKKYEVDLDGRGVPVQFVVFGDNGAITFTLDS